MWSPLPPTLQERLGTDQFRTGTSRRRFLAALGATTTTALAGCTALNTRETEITRQFDAAAVSSLAVDCDGGAVHVHPIDGDVIDVTATKKAHGNTKLENIEFDAGVDHETLSLRANEPNVVGFGGASVELAIGVPGPLDGADLRATDGAIDVTDVTADVEANVGNGAVAVDGVDGYVGAVTKDGTVSIADPAGIDGVTTGDGAVTVDVPALRDDATVHAENGAIEVALGPDLDADVHATVDDGQVTGTDVLDEVTREIRDHDRIEVQGVVGDPTYTLSIHAGDGVVKLTDQ